MRDGGRLSAAIEALDEIDVRHAPAHLALRAWGARARYAGARDRAFVSGLTLDALRHRRSAAWRMGEATNRARVLGVLAFCWDWPAHRIAAAAAEPHGPGALSAAETERLSRADAIDGAPAPVAGDFPDWLDGPLARAFGAARADEGSALAGRAPIDVRVNRLKTDAAHVLKALAAFSPLALGFPPDAIRIAAPGASERAAPVEATPAFERGWFEVQDAGSQIAAAASGDIAGAQVLDFCAGAGGKTLALASLMRNTGQLYAYDPDARRLAEAVRRARRAGVRNLQVRSPLEAAALDGLEARMDLVFVDAPCTGSGVWRRHPDAKWRLTPAQLARRLAEQDAILPAAAGFVKPGGRLVYATCSVLAEENEDRVAAFLASRPDFSPAPVALDGASAWATADGFLRLSPRGASTDGFFVAALERGRGCG